ncbi:hypothetical protein BH18ACT5_BH18ACT5_17370 [soil metagenome]
MTWTDERLVATLDSLAGDLDWPDAPDLSHRVINAIGSVSRPRRRRTGLVFAAIVVLALLSAPGQEAVAWLLRISGIRVEMTDTSVPMSPPRKLIDEVEVTLAEAEAAVGFDLLLPNELSVPDSVQLVDWGGGQQVAMLWNQSDRLPEVMDTGVGLLLIQFEARVDQQLLLKEASDATQITPLQVNGELGYFLSGAPHTVYFEGTDGVIADQIRLTGNVLIWMADAVTFRIESALDLEETLRIAESLG